DLPYAVVGRRGHRSASGAPQRFSAIRYRQALATLGATPLDDVAATRGRHTRAEAVRLGTLAAVGLIGPLHGLSFQFPGVISTGPGPASSLGGTVSLRRGGVARHGEQTLRAGRASRSSIAHAAGPDHWP